VAIEERRVVVTGLGLVTPWEPECKRTGSPGRWPFGHQVHRSLPNIEAFASRIAGQVPDFRAEDFIEPKEIKKMDLFIQYSIAAAAMAADDGGLKVDPQQAEGVGVIIGVDCVASIRSRRRNEPISTVDRGEFRRSLFQKSFQISRRDKSHSSWGKRRQLDSDVRVRVGHSRRRRSLSSHSSGIARGGLCRGAESAITPLGVGGFAAMKALSTRNDEPERASRPFDKERNGFIISEGSGVLILEERERAIKRGAKIYAEVIGYGANGDAYHMTAPAPEGEGAARCMRLALKDAGIAPSDVDYINAHGTSTEYNDANETQAIKKVFGEHAF